MSNSDSDITVLLYTANRVPAVIWSRALAQLKVSADGLPLVSVSQVPMSLGENICLGDIGHSHLNVYRQLLAGAKAIRTRWVAYQEDDILYPPGHFDYRPTDPARAAYDMHKLALYTWRNRVYHIPSGRHTSGCIVSRDLMVAALEERFQRDPAGSRPHWWGELGRYEAQLGVSVVPVEEFRSVLPTVIIYHEQALGYKVLGRRKDRGPIYGEEVPYWGRARELLIDG